MTGSAWRASCGRLEAGPVTTTSTDGCVPRGDTDRWRNRRVSRLLWNDVGRLRREERVPRRCERAARSSQPESKSLLGGARLCDLGEVARFDDRQFGGVDVLAKRGVNFVQRDSLKLGVHLRGLEEVFVQVKSLQPVARYESVLGAALAARGEQAGFGVRQFLRRETVAPREIELLAKDRFDLGDVLRRGAG